MGREGLSERPSPLVLTDVIRRCEDITKRPTRGLHKRIGSGQLVLRGPKLHLNRTYVINKQLGQHRQIMENDEGLFYEWWSLLCVPSENRQTNGTDAVINQTHEDDMEFYDRYGNA